MPPQDQSLPDAAVKALENGNTIEAIKITRETTGLGLKEAKDAVEAYIKEKSVTIKPEISRNSEIPFEAVTELEAGNLIGAVHATRTRTGLGLKDSKQAVERYLEYHPDTKARFHSITASRRNNVVRVALVVVFISIAIYAFLIAL